MNGVCSDYPTPPSANPTKYCRFCYSQFRIAPLFTDSTDRNQVLLSRIKSLVQIRLDPDRDGASAICIACQQKLTELELFRDRCQKLHEAVLRCRPFPTLELQLEEVQNGGLDYSKVADYSSLWVSIEPLVLDDYVLSREEDDENVSLEAEEKTGLNETCKNLNATELSVVVDRNDDRKNKRFWQALQHDVDSIPVHVRNALELTGRCREASLGFISPSTIKRIEESMRQSAQMLASQEEARGTDPKQAMLKYYGETYWDHPERFCFSPEEKCTILSIASAIQQNGIRHYLKAAKLIEQEVREKVENGTELAELLATKIREYYQARDSSKPNFKAFFKQLPKSRQCRVYRSPNGTIHAAVRCPICSNDSKVTLTDGNSRWFFYNYVQHCERRHYRVEVEPASGRRSASKARLETSTPKAKRSRTEGGLRSRSKSMSRGVSALGEEKDD
uniref:(northern house mosquito) hypothetical protein n=1 Tax=Culex pipiens TaxID=7175 RepID=A0A8D7ZXU7_CULPI